MELNIDFMLFALGVGLILRAVPAWRPFATRFDAMTAKNKRLLLASLSTIVGAGYVALNGGAVDWETLLAMVTAGVGIFWANQGAYHLNAGGLSPRGNVFDFTVDGNPGTYGELREFIIDVFGVDPGENSPLGVTELGDDNPAQPEPVE